MKNILKKYLNPQFLLRFKSMNIIISICIFVIFSFLLGIPIGVNSVSSTEEIFQEEYNYDVLRDIPDTPEIQAQIRDLLNQECQLEDGIELKCENLEEVDLYQKTIEYTKDGITKRITFVFDIFDFQNVYLEVEKINYNPKEEFVVSEDGPFKNEENVENYLVIFWSDALYFQAHPFGTDALNIVHNGQKLKTETIKIFYQNNIPNFKVDSKLVDNGPAFGIYILDCIIQGYANTLKLKSYTAVFLVGVFFTLITVLVLWIFFRKSGKLDTVAEYYNLAAIVSIPVFILFFILLWFVPSLINVFIFTFALLYLLVIYLLNSREELV